MASALPYRIMRSDRWAGRPAMSETSGATIPAPSGGAVEFSWFDPVTNSWVPAANATDAALAAALAGGLSGVAAYGDSAANVTPLSTRNDFYDGRGGNDTAIAGQGNDLLIGGAGNDSLDGSSGDDTLVGTALAPTGNVVLGAYSLPAIAPATGPDTLFGGNGNDLFWGVDAQDSVDGGTGNDTVVLASAATNGFTLTDVELVRMMDPAATQSSSSPRSRPA